MCINSSGVFTPLSIDDFFDYRFFEFNDDFMYSFLEGKEELERLINEEVKNHPNIEDTAVQATNNIFSKVYRNYFIPNLSLEQRKLVQDIFEEKIKRYRSPKELDPEKEKEWKELVQSIENSPFFHPGVSKDEARKKVQSRQAGAWLLVKMITEYCLVYVRPNENSSSLVPCVIPITTEPSSQDTPYEKTLEKYLEHAQLRTKAPLKGLKPTASKYDMQFQMYIEGSNIQAHKFLAMKAGKRRLKNSCICLRSSHVDGELSKLKGVTERSRIYVIGHSDIGLGFLTPTPDPKKNPISVEEYADIFSRHAPQLVKKTAGRYGEEGQPKIKISVIGCYTAQEDNEGNHSFAERLAHALAKKGIPATVFGRTETMQVEEDGTKLTAKGTKYQADGSVFTFPVPFTVHQNGQIELDK